jgi:ParB family chromosome partitioning protein
MPSLPKAQRKGELRKVCAHADCPVHHPKKEAKPVMRKWKAEQEKQRKQEAVARATGLRVPGAIGEAVPVRLMKRELLFIVPQMAAKLDLPRTEILAKLHQLTAQKGKEPLSKTVVAFMRRSGEGMLGTAAGDGRSAPG